MRRVAAALFLLCAVSSAAAQSIEEQLRNADRVIIPKGESEIVINDATKVPRQLQSALKKEQDPCGYERWLNQIPIRIIRLPETSRRLAALVPCGGITAMSRAYIFDRWWKEPRAMSFPIVAFPTGFGATRSPGYLQWDASTATLTALQETDICTGRIARYTYRYGQSRDRDDGMSWILLKAEQGAKQCERDDTTWRVYWEGPEWKEPLQVD